MKFPIITPTLVAEYHKTDDQFLVAIDACETTVTAYDTNRTVRAGVDFVEALIDRGLDIAETYHRQERAGR